MISLFFVVWKNAFGMRLSRSALYLGICCLYLDSHLMFVVMSWITSSYLFSLVFMLSVIAFHPLSSQNELDLFSHGSHTDF